MKAKTGSSKSIDVRYTPIDETTYPVQVVDGEYFYWRFWCQKNFIVYEKYKNNVRLGYLIIHDQTEKEVFTFNSMVNYCEALVGKEQMCIFSGK